MTAIKWDEVGKHFYETGVDHVTLYVQDGSTYKSGVAFNGVSSIEDNPSGAESTAIYADNIKYLDLTSKEDYGLNITAYSSPEAFDECDGTRTLVKGLKVRGQSRKRFGLVWRTNIGNDTEGNDYGYMYHIAYNLKAAPTTRSHNTINDSPEAQELSWECTSTDVVLDDIKDVNGNALKGSAKFEIATADLTEGQLKALEDTLFGTDPGDGSQGTDPTLPSPARLIEIISGADDSNSEPANEPTPPTVTYVEVTPVGTENPSQEGWYELGTDGINYILTEDTTVDSEKTYYTVSNGGEG